jgi:hypothetical protein
MATILKYVGKGQWKEIEEKDILPTDRIQKAKKSKPTSEDKIDMFLESVSKDIIKSGYRTTKVTTLLKGFGFSKRSSKNVTQIKDELKDRGYYTLPEYSNELKLESTIRIYNYPVRQLGELFASEKNLEDYVHKHHHYKKLKIKTVVRQHSPLGTKDRLDFKGQSELDEVVVLELKNAGGGKSAVEQVLRYSGLLQSEFPTVQIRQILVTGIQNYETALAIRGMRQEQRDTFEWYLYKYHKADDHFEFVRITDAEIFAQTKSN